MEARRLYGMVAMRPSPPVHDMTMGEKGMLDIQDPLLIRPLLFVLMFAITCRKIRGGRGMVFSLRARHFVVRARLNRRKRVTLLGHRKHSFKTIIPISNTRSTFCHVLLVILQWQFFRYVADCVCVYVCVCYVCVSVCLFQL